MCLKNDIYHNVTMLILLNMLRKARYIHCSGQIIGKIHLVSRDVKIFVCAINSMAIVLLNRNNKWNKVTQTKSYH